MKLPRKFRIAIGAPLVVVILTIGGAGLFGGYLAANVADHFTAWGDRAWDFSDRLTIRLCRWMRWKAVRLFTQ